MCVKDTKPLAPTPPQLSQGLLEQVEEKCAELEGSSKADLLKVRLSKSRKGR